MDGATESGVRSIASGPWAAHPARRGEQGDSFDEALAAITAWVGYHEHRPHHGLHDRAPARGRSASRARRAPARRASLHAYGVRDSYSAAAAVVTMTLVSGGGWKRLLSIVRQTLHAKFDPRFQAEVLPSQCPGIGVVISPHSTVVMGPVSVVGVAMVGEAFGAGFGEAVTSCPADGVEPRPARSSLGVTCNLERLARTEY